VAIATVDQGSGGDNPLCQESVALPCLAIMVHGHGNVV